MAYNEEMVKLYGIPYDKLTPAQKAIVREDSKRRSQLIEHLTKDALNNREAAAEQEAEFEKLLVQLYKRSQAEILADTMKTIEKVEANGGTWSYAYQSELTRKRGLFSQITAVLHELGQSEEVGFYEHLAHIYTDQFLREVFSLGQSINVRVDLNRLNPNLIKRAVSFPWSGAMFSERIWREVDRLATVLKDELTQSMILGESIGKLSQRITKRIDTSQYNALRVSRTETARVNYIAHRDALEDAGVTKVKYLTARDNRVCKVCSEDQDKVFELGKEPMIPRHPNCRCDVIPEIEPVTRGYYNEITGSIRGAENYQKWIEAHKEQLDPEGNLLDGWAMDLKTGKVVAVAKGSGNYVNAPTVRRV